jgi:16S rRNA (cytosine967-C5)-methyltransferase
VLHRVLPRAITELAEIQGAMLRRAADWLKPGGALVYSVCSLEPQEGEEVARAFLADCPDYELTPITGDDLAAGMTPSPEGWLRMLPGLFADQGGADSFFIARFTRRGG